MRMPAVAYDVVDLKGGLDLVTPTLSLAPGVARASVNWECNVTGGYSTIQGYERFDGRSAPSSATAVSLSIAYANNPSLGQTVTGQTSGATGVVCGVDSPAGVLVVTKVVGTFAAGETLKVGATVTGVLGNPVSAIVSSPKNLAIYQAAAADVYRALINPIPGSGPVRGAIKYNGTVYAFRDNVGATATLMYASSAAGWVAVNLGYRVSFTAGTAQINDGDTVVGGTSGASAVALRVALQSGAWSGAAAGIIVLASVTGTFQAGEALKVSGASKATCSGAQVAQTLAVGGKFEFVTGNFGGATGKTKLYGADGTNKAFEFDGTAFVPITTGMTADAPKHIIIHRNYLFLSFGASLQFSSLGLPYQFSIILGAGELNPGDAITGMLVQPGASQTAALAIYTVDNTYILYGSSNSTWLLVTFNEGVGALDYSDQNLTNSYVFCDRGVVSLQTTLNYGNFDQATLTHNIIPFIQQERTRLATSCVNRAKSQYRAFFNDGYGIYLTVVNDQYLGAMPIWFPDAIFNSWSGPNGDGSDIAFICGATSGYVYQLDVGTSFDGAALGTSVTLNFNPSKSPRIRKRYRRAALEVSGNGYSEISFSNSLGYLKGDADVSLATVYPTPFNQAFWDAFTWDAFTWDGLTLAPSEVDLTGTAENIAVTLASNSNYFQPVTVNSLILHYSERRGTRGI